MSRYDANREPRGGGARDARRNPAPRPRPQKRRRTSSKAVPPQERTRQRQSIPAAARTGGSGTAAGRVRPSAAQAKRRRRRIWRNRILAVLLLAVIAVAVAGGVVYAQISRGLPDPNAPLKGRDQTTIIFDRNGKQIAKLFAEQNRTDVPLEKIPAQLRQAVIATEDERFYEHQGVDPIGILRALWTDIRHPNALQGGSTITQQYVKVAIVTPERTLKRKLMEALLAYRLEKNYSKDEILSLYLNTIYFGHGAYGVQTASQTYFGKNVSDLGLAECAMLAGVIKSPGRYSPFHRHGGRQAAPRDGALADGRPRIHHARRGAHGVGV